MFYKKLVSVLLLCVFSVSICVAEDPDSTSPVLVDIVVIPTETDVTFDFTTNEDATSSVTYGLTDSYELSTVTGPLSMTHSVITPSLTCGTTYHYQISVTDAFLNTTTQITDQTFETSPCVLPPDIEIVPQDTEMIPQDQDIETAPPEMIPQDIETIPPEPNHFLSGEMYASNLSLNIYWDDTGDATVKCEYSYDGAPFIELADCNDTTEISANFPTVPGVHTLSLRSTDDATPGNVAVFDGEPFTVIAEGHPYGDVYLPQKNQTYTTYGWTPEVYWTDNTDDITTCEYSYDDSLYLPLDCQLNGSDILAPGSSGESTLFLRVTDSANNVTLQQRTFLFDDDAPVVTITSPTVGQEIGYLFAWKPVVDWGDVGVAEEDMPTSQYCQYSYDQIDWFQASCEKGGADIGLPMFNGPAQLYIKSGDVAGNESDIVSINFQVSASDRWLAHTQAGQKKWIGVDVSSDGQRMIAAAQNDSIYLSEDGGATWQAQNSFLSAKWFSVTISPDGNHLAASIQGGALYISDDFGATWNEITAAGDADYRYIDFSSDGLKVVISSVYDLGIDNRGPIHTAIYTNGSWDVTERVAAGLHWWTDISYGANDTIFATIENYWDFINNIYYSDGSVSVSNDNGITWSTLPLEQRSYSAVSPDKNGERVFLSAPSRSSDAHRIATLSEGGNWIEQDWDIGYFNFIDEHEYHNYSSLSRDSTALSLFTYGTGWYTSWDFGENWRRQGSLLPMKFWSGTGSSSNGEIMAASSNVLYYDFNTTNDWVPSYLFTLNDPWPLISNIVITPTTTSASVAFDTNKYTIAHTESGLQITYGTTTDSVTPSMAHTIEIPSLTPCTQYHAEIFVEDALGKTAQSGDQIFTTLCLPDAPLTVTCSPSTTSALTGEPITWTAVATGGSSSNYTFEWTGTDGLTGTDNPLGKTYDTAGTKSATVVATEGGSPSEPVTCSTTISAPPSRGGGSPTLPYGCTDPKALNFKKNVLSRSSLCEYPPAPPTTNIPPKLDSAPIDTTLCSAKIYPTKYIKLGGKNDPAQVKLLEQYLTLFEGENLPIDSIYSQDDANAVIRWQEKYRSEILTPWGETQGTGYVFITSLRKFRELFEAQCKPDEYTAPETPTYFTRDLKLGMEGDDVRKLQEILITKATGGAAQDLARIGVTGYFGPKTKLALVEFQKSRLLHPATGEMGIITIFLLMD